MNNIFHTFLLRFCFFPQKILFLDGIPSVKWFGSEGDYNVLGKLLLLFLKVFFSPAPNGSLIRSPSPSPCSDRPAGPVFGRSFQLLRQEIFLEDCFNVGRPDAPSIGIYALTVRDVLHTPILAHTLIHTFMHAYIQIIFFLNALPRLFS